MFIRAFSKLTMTDSEGLMLTQTEFSAHAPQSGGSISRAELPAGAEHTYEFSGRQSVSFSLLTNEHPLQVKIFDGQGTLVYESNTRNMLFSNTSAGSQGGAWLLTLLNTNSVPVAYQATVS